jgi:dTDP-4-dehydrorhamnose 3,5-epimerase
MTRDELAVAASLPAGVKIYDVPSFADARGFLAVVHQRSSCRAEWPLQWNVMTSGENTLRGMHVHIRHADSITAVAGEAVIGLVDLRQSAAGTLTQGTVTITTNLMQLLVIPPGVLHGVYTPRSSVILNGLSHEFDPDDDLEVRFDDPQIDLDWAVTDPVLSERDRDAPSIAAILEQLASRGIEFPELGG